MNDFERYRPVILAWFLFAAAGGADFGSVILQGASPVTPEVYGPWVYQIPAWVWVSAQTIVAGLGFVGALMRWRRVAFGAAVGLVLYFAFLAAAGGLAGASGQVLLRNCRSFIGPFTVVIAGLCWGRGYGRG